MMRRKHDCTDCIAYCNILNASVHDYCCGLGFKVEEVAEGGDGTWRIAVHPREECTIPHMPKSKEEFVQIAKERGIDWDINDVITEDEIY